MASRLRMTLGLVGAALLAGGAQAADVGDPQPAPAGPAVFSPVDEIRAGVFAHNWIHDENAPVDLSVEALSSPLSLPGYASPWVAGNPWVSWFFAPRLNLGAMVNTGGKDSYAFAGFAWRIPIYNKFFFEGELGGAVNNAPHWNEPGRVDMGCNATFRESGGFGYQFDANWDLIASVEHVSHASFCGRTNPGLTQVGVRIGYKF
ncbi:lipid A 3-O-deacylase PagL [Roseiarcus fermentans]|uniref:Lipid A 3-O-deacylase PagL n=1 Tax=Roseiarcus fermentans TaxID=1473586 RepID=A0A366FI03_9HYPH|nr:acyloxyacyl hydrolase [Roseiarcus fermentans]RBP14303.1 lipid A 3-O-deacylase PagL [Roseiarcus fermentans]